jgi:nucleoside-diphosphate-sugar epimerase
LTLAGKPLAITGATGFVGSTVLDLVRAKGLAVRALTRKPQANEPGIEWVEGSLADAAALARLCHGAGAVLHIAGAVNLPTRADFAAANIAGTQGVADAAKAAGIARLVHVSSLAAREPGLSDYGWSKAGAEQVVQASALDWTIVRPPAIYGPRDTEILDMFRIARWGLLPVPAGGRASMIHVEDLARLLLAAASGAGADWTRAMFEPDDGTPQGWSNPDMARAIGESVGRRVWAPGLSPAVLRLGARADGWLRGKGARLTMDRARYMSHPDWVSNRALAVPEHLWMPRIATRQGLAATAAWYRAAGWL